MAISTAILLSSTTGCALHGLSFRDYHLIEIKSPHTRAHVALPITVRWETKPTLGAHSYALFVDRSPPPPGRGLTYFRLDDRNGIYTSKLTSFVLDAVNPLAGAAPSERNQHEITIVPLDSRGHRIGEVAATIEFTVKT